MERLGPRRGGWEREGQADGAHPQKPHSTPSYAKVARRGAGRGPLGPQVMVMQNSPKKFYTEGCNRSGDLPNLWGVERGQMEKQKSGPGKKDQPVKMAQRCPPGETDHKGTGGNLTF
ncbi:hypothetical protein TNIN_207061 [Trichonephila inaurata madagascariensis]|uniref:Uncharacterized protein n=1 Tax=Trichonephila inaurata madagascariensis TaxID=2747483 RepID=A0A8X7C4Q9_9ARAC|nr:hypothetical protein TNIN_207061 [Trichonephila inaurata madagascariensis]